MKLNHRFLALAGLFAAISGVSLAAQAFPVCVQNGGVLICNDNGVVTACSGSGGVGICTDSNGHTNVGTTQGNTSIVTGTDGTHVWTNPTPPPPPPRDEQDRWRDHDRDRWGHDRWGHDHDRWDHRSYPYPDTTPSYPDNSPSYPDTTPSYPDTSSSYPDTSSSSSNSVASLCVGTYSGKFVSGEKAALVFRADGSIYLKARGQAYAASGSCVLVTKKKAQFQITLDDNAAYGFSGTIVKAADGSKVVSAQQLKNGRAIDRLALSSGKK